MNNTKHDRALKKTIITIGIIAVIFALATVWPPIIGYFLIGVFVSMIVGAIYAMFIMYEETKSWNKRD